MTELPLVGESVDVLHLRDLKRELRINVYVYLDKEIAENSNLSADIEKYRFIDIDYRPMLEIEEFLKNMQKQMKQISGGANIELMLTEEPLNATILEIGEMPTAVGPRTYLKTLLPYLDEMEEIEYSNATLPEK